MFVPEDEAGEVREENSSFDVAPETGSQPVQGESTFQQEQYPEQGYADAHYEPAGESTVPPRYYTPPERPVKEPRVKKEKKASGFGWGKAICVALVAALLGGFIGSALTAGSLNARMTELEKNVSQQSESIQAVADSQEKAQTVAAEAAETGSLSAAQIYEQACDQVVGITTDVTFTNFFGMTSSSAVTGSGFILSEDGYIITNYHVIEYAVQQKSDPTVILHDGTEYTASIVGTEQANDIAVLKIEASGLSPVSFGDSDSIRVGDTVYAVGNPLGELEFSMSTGHISALGRVISTEESESINMFQMDAAVNPGNSGGPVYNSLGQVVGVVTAKYSDSGVEGLGFAIPANDAAGIADDLMTKGYVTGKAYMGLSIDPDYGVDRNSIAYAVYNHMPLGAYVMGAEKDSCADKAGLEAGDIITRLGDTDISNYSDLRAALRQYHAGDSAELTYYRAGDSFTVTVTFDEAKPAASAAG